MRGRPRKPVAQHLADDTYRHDRHAQRAGAFSGEPAKPRGLSKEAAACWQQIVPELIKAGVVSAIDSLALAHLAALSARITALNMSDPEALKYLAEFRRFSALFGLTPVDRQRLSVAPKAAKAQGLGAFSRKR